LAQQLLEMLRMKEEGDIKLGLMFWSCELGLTACKLHLMVWVGACDRHSADAVIKEL
jgi:hypothetical protein